MAGAFLWVLRARFFRLDVRRLGTAMEVSCQEGGTAVVPRDHRTIVTAIRQSESSGPFVAHLAERVPSAVGHRRALARAIVEVGPAVRTQPPAVLAALDERRRREEPVLAHRLAEVEL